MNTSTLDKKQEKTDFPDGKFMKRRCVSHCEILPGGGPLGFNSKRLAVCHLSAESAKKKLCRADKNQTSDAHRSTWNSNLPACYHLRIDRG
jgi:hypothetical protein